MELSWGKILDILKESLTPPKLTGPQWQYLPAIILPSAPNHCPAHPCLQGWSKPGNMPVRPVGGKPLKLHLSPWVTMSLKQPLEQSQSWFACSHVLFGVCLQVQETYTVPKG